jgi:hypothetical protein
MATIDIVHERFFVKVDSGTNIRKFTVALTQPHLVDLLQLRKQFDEVRGLSKDNTASAMVSL